MADEDPVLMRWQANGRVVCYVAHDGALKIIGLMDSARLAHEAAQAHNEALTGKAGT